MWYLSPSCSPLQALVPGGVVYEEDKRGRGGGGGGGVGGSVGGGMKEGIKEGMKEGMKEGVGGSVGGEEDVEGRWARLAGRCCMSMKGAP